MYKLVPGIRPGWQTNKIGPQISAKAKSHVCLSQSSYKRIGMRKIYESKWHKISFIYEMMKAIYGKVSRASIEKA